MSVSAATTIRRFPRWRRSPTREPRIFLALAWTTVALDVAMLSIGASFGPWAIKAVDWEVAVWIVLVGVVGLAPIPSGRGPVLVMDLPLLLGAAFVYGPIVGGLIALIGCWDAREFRREITLTRSLWNRAQTSLSVAAAALVFELAGGDVGLWPRAVLATLLALVADTCVNYGLVSLAFALPDRVSLLRVIASMKFGPARLFAPAYVSLGFLGLLLAEIFLHVGVLGLAAFVAPVLLAHQAFSARRGLAEASALLRRKTDALAAASQGIADERRDERRQIAAALHDDVVQSLHNVTVYASLIRENLRMGRLLELEDDLPVLLRASREASDGIRRVIRDLRESSLGRYGLEATLRLFVRQLTDESGIRIEADIERVEATPELQLTLYQVAREALTNAVRHSGASEVRLNLRSLASGIELVIRDDGVGFPVSFGAPKGHFGLELLRERVDLSGGVLLIESDPGAGTKITASFGR